MSQPPQDLTLVESKSPSPSKESGRTSVDTEASRLGELPKFANGKPPDAPNGVIRPSLDDPEFRHRRSGSLSSPYAPSISLQQPDSEPLMADVVAPVVEEPPKGRVRGFYDKNRGVIYVLIAQFFGVLMNVTTRILEIEGNNGKGMHPLQILFVRMVITTALCMLYMWWTETPHFPLGMKEVRWLLALRAIGGFFGVFGIYYSIMYLPLADATVITFLSPIISCFACSILLKEPFTRMEQVSALISFAGVTLIARPTALFKSAGGHAPPGDGSGHGMPSHRPPGRHGHPHKHGGGKQSSPGHSFGFERVTSAQRMSAVLVALIGVLGQAMAFTTMRWMGKRAHPLLSVNYYCVMCAIVSAVAMAGLPSLDFVLPQNAKEWSYLLFLGCTGFAMQCLLSAGLQIEKSSRATNMVYTQVVFAIIFDKLIMGTDPSPLSVIGSTLVVSSALYVASMKESLKQRQEAENARLVTEASSGRAMEMTSTARLSGARSDEERGLVAGMDEADDIEIEPHHQNGNAKS